MRQYFCFLYAILVAVTEIMAQTLDSVVLKKVELVAAQFKEKTDADFATNFAPVFLEKVPADQLANVMAAFFSQLGKVTSYKLSQVINTHSAKYELFFEKGYVAPLTIAVDPATEKIVGLFIGAPAQNTNDIDKLIADLTKMPGAVSLCINELKGKVWENRYSLNREKALAIGSACKLYILAALDEAVNQRQLRYDQVIYLNADNRSLPSGEMQHWPAGSPVTLHTLALKMISISDNTATDELLYFLGREKVEAILQKTGHSKPELNIPFVSTLELFKLKGRKDALSLGQSFIQQPVAEKRKLLERLKTISKDSLELFKDGKPFMIESLEWFASAADICSLLQYLDKSSAAARQVLAVNPGLSFNKENWRYIGFKGGSEPGVLSLNYILVHKNDENKRYTLSITINNPTAPIEEKAVFGTVARLIDVLAAQP